MSYEAYLRSNHWLNFREKALAAARFECEECGYDENLNVHHLTYVNIGNESLDDVQVLCYRCHMQTHEDEDNAYFHALNNKETEPTPENLLDVLGLDDTDDIDMHCDNCGIKQTLPAGWHSAKLGCKCGNEHQRWMIDAAMHNAKSNPPAAAGRVD